MTQQPLPPAVLSALTAVELAGEEARKALVEMASPGGGWHTGPARTGEPSAVVGELVDTENLPFPGDAGVEDLLSGSYALASCLSAGPRTAAQWYRVKRLALYLADAAGYAAQEAEQEEAEQAGTSGPAAAVGEDQDQEAGA